MRTRRWTRVGVIVCACALAIIGCTRDDEPSLTSTVPDGAINVIPTATATQVPTVTLLSANEHIAAAWLLFERGDYRDAIDEARRAAMADPESAAALHARGYLNYVVDGGRLPALTDLRKAWEIDPDNPEIILDLMEVQIGTLTGSAIHELTDAAVEAGADPFELMIVVSRYRSIEGNHRNAAAIANEALGYASSPEQRNKALELRAWYEIQQDLISDALVTYQQIDPSAPAPTAETGALLATWLSGARDQVRADMEAALKPYPLSPNPSRIKERIEPVLGELSERIRTELQEDVLDRAEAAWDESGYEAAIAVIEESFRGASMPPSTGEAFWRARGDIYMQSGRFELATTAYTETLLYNASDPGARADRAAAWLELGRYNDAVADAVRVGEFSGDPRPEHLDFANSSILACEVEARAYYGLNQEETGDSVFAGCANLAGFVDRRAELLATQARTQLENGYYEKALATAEWALEISDSTSPETTYGAYGAALVSMGRFDEAVEAYERATRPIDYGDRIGVRRPYVERLVLLELNGDEAASAQYVGLIDNVAEYLPDRLPADYALELVTGYRSDMERWYEAGLAAQAGG